MYFGKIVINLWVVWLVLMFVRICFIKILVKIFVFSYDGEIGIGFCFFINNYKIELNV